MRNPDQNMLLRRAAKVIVPSGSGSQSDEVVATFALEIAQYGYLLKPEVTDALRRLTDDQLRSTYRNLREVLQESVGAHRTFTPFYPGFPDEVLRLSEAELYLNAIRHYVSGGEFRPAPTLTASSVKRAIEEVQFKRAVGLTGPDDLRTITVRLLTSASSLSPTDVSDLSWLLKNFKDRLDTVLPAKVKHRENAAIIASELWTVSETFARTFISANIKTATDALRLCVAFNSGDVSLAAPTKFLVLPRPIRRLVLDILESAPQLVEDFRRRPERWKRLGERLHPGAKKDSHPKTFHAFSIIRKNLPAETFASRAEQAMSSPSDLLEICLERPGEFARRFDALVRRHPEPLAVVAALGTVVDRVSTSVLLQLHAHLDPSVPSARLRVFLPKGQTAKMWARLNSRNDLPLAVRQGAVQHIERALIARFAKLSSLGTTFVDPQLRKFMIPLAMRTTSRSLRTVARGSRIAAPDDQFVRLFLWWTNGRGRTDIDLSAALFDANYHHLSTVAYYNLKDWGAVHSGDIVDAPKGAAEFIDFDTRVLLKRNVRYVIMIVTSFSQQPFGDLPECFAGWMARKSPNSGEIFDARTVVDRADLTSETTIAIPLIFDLKNREIIWSDLSLRMHPHYVNAVANNLRGISIQIEAMVTLRRPTLHTLFSLHARARGELVSTRAQADTVFALDSEVTPFSVDVIRSEFIS